MCNYVWVKLFCVFLPKALCVFTSDLGFLTTLPQALCVFASGLTFSVCLTLGFIICIYVRAMFSFMRYPRLYVYLRQSCVLMSALIRVFVFPSELIFYCDSPKALCVFTSELGFFCALPGPLCVCTSE